MNNLFLDSSIWLSLYHFNNFTEIKLQKETDKEELIIGLATSPNFATTHSIIAKLFAYTERETDKVKRLCAAAVDNNQVSWIFYDQDILGFYETILKTVEMKKT